MGRAVTDNSTPNAPTSMRLVGDYVVPCEGDGNVIAGGAIDIDADGRIVAVGSESHLAPTTAPTHNLGGLLMPGLVNAHAHTPMTLLRSAGDGLDLQRWLTEVIWPREAKMRPNDAHWGMKLGSLEMLLAGVTTSCEMYFFEEAMVDAVRETGGRLVLCPGVISALLPGGNVEPRIAELSGLHDTYHDANSRITVGYGPHSVYDLTPTQVGEIARQAREVDALLHIHLEETQAERDQVLATQGQSATKALAEAGVFEGPTVVAHGVWLDDDDMKILAAANVSIAHCPVSNLKLGSGIAPVTSMRAHGLNVALGTDGVASNDNLDLWEEMKLAPLLARGATSDPAALSAAGALDMATRAGARAVHLDDVGELRPGAWADIIRLDLDRPGFAPAVDDDLLTHLVFAGSSAAVTDVWVAGKHVVADRAPTQSDLREAITQCRDRGQRLAKGA